MTHPVPIRPAALPAWRVLSDALNRAEATIPYGKGKS